MEDGFWGGRVALVRGTNHISAADIDDADMELVWGGVQTTPHPRYEDWLPFDTRETLSNLRKLTMYGDLVFTRNTTNTEDLLSFVELGSVLYYNLVRDPLVKGRYSAAATWAFESSEVTCMFIPLCKAMARTMSAAIAYSVEVEAPGFVEMTSRSSIHNIFYKILGFARFILDIYDNFITDDVVRTFVRDDIEQTTELITLLRAYMFYNFASIKDTLKQEDKRRKYSQIKKPEVTSKVIQSLLTCKGYYQASIRLLQTLPSTVPLPCAQMNKFLNPWALSRSSIKLDAGDVIVDEQGIAEAEAARQTARKTIPTSWANTVKQDLLETCAIQHWVTSKTAIAVCLARVALANGEPIAFSDAWESYHMRIAVTTIPHEPEEVLNILLTGKILHENNKLIHGFNVKAYIRSDALEFVFTTDDI